jgi:hypothetical protein
MTGVSSTAGGCRKGMTRRGKSWLAGAAWLGVVLCMAAALLSAPCYADPTPSQKETARGLMDRGARLRAAGDNAGALKAFLAANEIMHVPSTALQAARAHSALGQLVEARDLALEAARYPERVGEPRAFQKARADAAELARQLASRISSLKIKVLQPPRGIEVRVDGTSVPLGGGEGIESKVNPGAHRVVAAAPGFEDASVSVDLREAENKSVTLTLKPSAAGKGPALSAEGGASAGEATAETKGTPTSQPDHSEHSSTSPLVYVGLGLGAAGIIAGSVTGYVAYSKTTDVQSHCNDNVCPKQFESDADSAKSMAMGSNIACGIGVAGLGLALVGWLALGGKSEPPPPAATTSVRMMPLVGPGQVGVTARF